MYDQSVIDSWIDGHEVVAKNESEESGNLVIVAKDDDDRYQMCRFFVSGAGEFAKTFCSVDIDDSDADGVIKALLSMRK